MKKLALPLTLLAVVLAVVVLTAGCRQSAPEIAQRPLSVRELLQNPKYDSEIKIFGHITEIDQESFAYFQLESGDISIEVRRRVASDDDGAGSSPADMGSIKNGDWVVVTGFLKEGSAGDKRDYFLSHSVLLTRGSCTSQGCPLPEVTE